jgi:hypothetical protein
MIAEDKPMVWCPICGRYEKQWKQPWILFIEIENWMQGKEH